MKSEDVVNIAVRTIFEKYLFFLTRLFKNKGGDVLEILEHII